MILLKACVAGESGTSLRNDLPSSQHLPIIIIIIMAEMAVI